LWLLRQSSTRRRLPAAERQFSCQQGAPDDKRGIDGAARSRYLPPRLIPGSWGEIAVTYRLISTAALMLGAAMPAAAAAQSTAPAAAAPQQQPTRAAMQRNLDVNFKAIDTNNDGTLVATELGAAEVKAQQQRAVAARTQVETRFGQLDTNKDGQLSKAEFLVLVPAPRPAASNGQSLVAALDKNKDGKVTADEYRAPMFARFDSLDTNKDGVLSVQERQAAAQQPAQAVRQ
jgi:Ca2+-binding EF-hand superfamily protein